MFKHSTRAAFAVLSFPGAEPRHGKSLAHSGELGAGLPQVRCRLADQ